MGCHIELEELLSWPVCSHALQRLAQPSAVFAQSALKGLKDSPAECYSLKQCLHSQH